jgi:hypothetical protein
LVVFLFVSVFVFAANEERFGKSVICS